MRRGIMMALLILTAGILYVWNMHTGPAPAPSGGPLAAAVATAAPAVAQVHQEPGLLIGTLPGALTYDEQEALLAAIFRHLGVARPVKIRERGLTAWDGYSPDLPVYLQDIQGRRINLQGALRYRPGENRTYLHLGSPIIGQDF